jgi:hypothetical protein
MNNLAPAPRRGNMLNVYNVIGLNTVGLRVITKASKLGKEKTKSTLQNLVFKGYVIKAGSYYCLNTRIEFDTRQAEISKVQDRKKAVKTYQQFADQENAGRQGAFNANWQNMQGHLGQSNSGGVGLNMQANAYLEQHDLVGHWPETEDSTMNQGGNVKESWVTSDRLYMASITVIVVIHLIRDAGLL